MKANAFLFYYFFTAAYHIYADMDERWLFFFVLIFLLIFCEGKKKKYWLCIKITKAPCSMIVASPVIQLHTVSIWFKEFSELQRRENRNSRGVTYERVQTKTMFLTMIWRLQNKAAQIELYLFAFILFSVLLFGYYSSRIQLSSKINIRQHSRSTIVRVKAWISEGFRSLLSEYDCA